MLRVLERLAEGASLAEVLGALVEQVKQHPAVMECNIVIDQGDGSLRVGSNGDLGASEGGSEWSEPIMSPSGAPRGALILTMHQAGAPSEELLQLVKPFARLAGLAVERKRTEDELRQREAEISAVLDGVLDGIITIDARGHVESFNRAAEKMFGWRAEEVIAKNVSVLMPPEVSAEHDQYIERYQRTGERRIIGIGREVLGRRKDGSTFPVDLGVSELWIGDRQRFTGILRDLTVKKQLEAQVLRSQKLEAVGTLAAGVAHDFNNLLMGIMGCVAIALKKVPADSSARPFLDEAKAAAERGGKLTRQLLAFSRRTPSEVRPLSIDEVIKANELMLRRSITEEIELTIELSPSGGPIRGDANQLEQVLVNLVVNARDAISGRGTITIRTADWSEPGRGALVRLTVSDTGSGMDEPTQARAFEPFFTTKGPDRGTGLGLSTVYGIVEQHGGFIELESELGRGTSVHLYFPRHDEHAPGHKQRPGERGGGERILLVEDDRLVRTGIAHFLSGSGHRVIEAGSGQEALEQLRREGRPDLIITDLIMPDMSGLELVERMRLIHPRLAVIVMSGYATQATVKQLEAASAVFIEKPFAYEELSRKIGLIFGRSNGV